MSNDKDWVLVILFGLLLIQMIVIANIKSGQSYKEIETVRGCYNLR